VQKSSQEYNKNKNVYRQATYKRDTDLLECKKNMKTITGLLLIVCMVTVMMFSPSFEMIIVRYNEYRGQLSVTVSDESNGLPSALLKIVYAQTPSRSSENTQTSHYKNKQSSYDLSQPMGLVPIITAIVGVSSGFAAWATHYYQKKQYKLNALIGAFEELNDLKHSQARRNVYTVYSLFKGASPDTYLNQLDKKRDDVELVKTDFDQIGALIKNKLVDKEVFLDVYGATILKYWDYLSREIDMQKTQRDDKLYMKNFEWIVDQAKDFVKSNSS
jgi:hypothetical protein